MQVAVVSDTHGQLEWLEQALASLRRDYSPGACIHLGDFWEDAFWLEEKVAVPVYAVPGVFHEVYASPGVENRRQVILGGWRLFLTHTPGPHHNDDAGDPDPGEVARAGQADVILYGHTHTPRLEVQGEVLWACPGHLKAGQDKGQAPSFGVLHLEKRGLRAELVDLISGVVFDTATLKK